MNNCCKFELRKAMQKQTDVAMTVGMTLLCIEAIWQSQLEHGICRIGCDGNKPFEGHNKHCAFVKLWNGEEMTYLRYSLNIPHEVKVLP